MTLLQRRPREVYRVFEEDEFLVGGMHEFRAPPAAPIASRPGVRRIAAAAALVAASSALAGLLAIAEVLPVSSNRRRTVALRFASRGSAARPAPSSTHVEALAAPQQPGLSARARAFNARERYTCLRRSRRPRVDLRLVLARRAASRALALALVAAPRSAPPAPAPAPEPESEPEHASSTVGGSDPSSADSPEFGFER
jgi:hypothetical protein